jgi:hypothetical protein
VKLRNTGWEADRLYRNTVTAEFTTPSRDIVITGYAFKLAMIPSDAPFLGSLQSAQVLWWCAILGIPDDPQDDFGPVTLKDNALKLTAIPPRRWWKRPLRATTLGAAQNLHGGAHTVNNILAASILKASPWTSAVNDVLHMSGLSLAVPAKSTIQMFAGHAGAGPVDFEIQGGLLYKTGEAHPAATS